jgi:hypothetical protein
MKITMKTSGNLDKKLDELKRRAEELQGQWEVPLSDLMPPSFIAKCSAFSSLEQLFDASPFEIRNTDDFRAISDDQWDAFISENTSFSTWREMQDAAVQKWTRRQLGLS